MKTKKFAKILAAVFCAGAIAAPCAVTPAFANSGPRREHGVTALGTVVKGDKSALAVESELLTFNLSEFPYADGQGSVGQSTVSASYRFVNTSANTVHTTMAFPMEGSLPYYATDEYGKFHPLGETEISVDGAAVDFEVRHTLGSYSDFKESVSKIGDDYYKTDKFKPDSAVTKISVTVDMENYDTVYVTGNIKYLSESVFVAGTESGDARFYFSKEQNSQGGAVGFSAEEDYERCIYVIGDPSDVRITWETEGYNRDKMQYETVDLPVSVTMSDLTLLDALKETKGAREAISDLDWYNAVVRLMEACVKKSIPRSVIEPSTSEFIEWYVYDVTVAPNGAVDNTVTAPIYPSIDYGYDPHLYDYEYLISPASCWADFGTLKVQVNTDYFMCNAPAGFARADGGYSAEYSSLPKGEITFSLCETDSPRARNSGIALVIFIVIILASVMAVGVAGVVVSVIYLKKHSKKRR